MKPVVKSVVTVGLLCGLLALLRLVLAENALALAGGALIALAAPLWTVWIFDAELVPIAAHDARLESGEWLAFRRRIAPLVRWMELVTQAFVGLWIAVTADGPWLTLGGLWAIRFCLLGLGGERPRLSQGLLTRVSVSALFCFLGLWLLK